MVPHYFLPYFSFIPMYNLEVRSKNTVYTEGLEEPVSFIFMAKKERVPEYEDSWFLQSVGNNLSVYTASQLRVQ
jgi:hypothetical protein